MSESPLRDLARKLREVAREHIAYSQVADFMNHVESHLQALAFHEETCTRRPAPYVDPDTDREGNRRYWADRIRDGMCHD